MQRSPLFRFLSISITFLFSLQVLTIGLSLIQVRITPGLARGILAASLAASLVPFFLAYQGLPDFKAWSLRFRRWQVPFLAFLGVAALTYLVLWACASIMPDLSWDGNAYHIPTLSMWDARGYIHWINTTYLEGIINGYPKGAELVSYLLVKAFGNSIINTVNLAFLPLGVLGIALIARSLGARRLLSLCSGAAFL